MSGHLQCFNFSQEAQKEVSIVGFQKCFEPLSDTYDEYRKWIDRACRADNGMADKFVLVGGYPVAFNPNLSNFIDIHWKAKNIYTKDFRLVLPHQTVWLLVEEKEGRYTFENIHSALASVDVDNEKPKRIIEEFSHGIAIIVESIGWRLLVVSVGHHGRDAKVEGMVEDPCVVCFESMGSGSIVTATCGHQFHEQCFQLWIQRSNKCIKCKQHVAVVNGISS